MKNLLFTLFLGIALTAIFTLVFPGLGKVGVGILGGICLFAIGRSLKIL